VSLRCAQKLTRLWAIVAERVTWEKQLVQVKRMRQWVLDAEHMLVFQLGARGRRREQCNRGRTSGCLAAGTGQAGHGWHPFGAGTGVLDRVLAGPRQPAIAFGAVL
jgi:hypothetical protein